MGVGKVIDFYPPQTPPTHNEQQIGQDGGKSITPTPATMVNLSGDSTAETQIQGRPPWERQWKLPELERSLVVQTSFEVEVGVASDGVSCEADLSFILWKVGDPPQCFH